MLTLMLPVFVGFLALTVDMAYAYKMRNTLQVTAEAAALAATAFLFPDPTQAAPNAQAYVEKNMPAASYGSVLANADVLGGIWTDSTKAFSGGIPVANCTGTTCNAVKVTTKIAGSQFFAWALSFNVSAAAIATYGFTGSGVSPPIWSIVEDISGSFSQQIASAKAADQALLDCVKKYSAPGSKLGVALFTGLSPNPAYQPAISVLNTANPNDMTNYNALTNKITAINGCGSSGMPACSGSNVSAGMTEALNSSMLCPGTSCTLPSPTDPSRAMVIVTDGIPNCTSGSSPSCSSDQQLLDRAVAQADAAASKGIDVYTIYFGSSASDAAWLAGLVRGKGFALKTPTASQLADKMSAVCLGSSGLQRRLVW